jgi:glycerate 2-kinase
MCERGADERKLLLDMFAAALKAADPMLLLPQHIASKPRGRTIVVGAGKAAARMAAAFETAWTDECSGLVVTRYGHVCPTSRISVAEAGHPIPDEAGVRATRRIMQLVAEAGPDDLVVALLSGGASSLLVAPAEDLRLEEKQRVTRALLLAGAPITDINYVRCALSAVKAGRLAGLTRARVVTYVISDVPGDDAGVVGSGPTIAREIAPAHVISICEKYGVQLDDQLRQVILAPRRFSARAGEVVMLANSHMALDAAAARARALGINPLILGDDFEGEARIVGRTMASIARQFATRPGPIARPCVLLSGGETTVTVKANGRGGRNGEFLLSLAIALRGLPGVSALACDTDGVDGSEDNAGAWFGPDLLARGEAMRLDAQDYLDRNDSFGYFVALDNLIFTGPTLTNVNDFRAILIR